MPRSSLCVFVRSLKEAAARQPGGVGAVGGGDILARLRRHQMGAIRKFLPEHAVGDSKCSAPFASKASLGRFPQRSLKEAAAQRTSNVFADLAGPGAFNDPDELQIGVRPCGDAGARAQYLLWALAKAPLILSAPLTQGSQKAKFGSDEPGLCAEDLKLLLNPVNCHDIAGIWVAFFSRWQRCRC